jgi:hypothetical protein
MVKPRVRSGCGDSRGLTLGASAGPSVGNRALKTAEDGKITNARP